MPNMLNMLEFIQMYLIGKTSLDKQFSLELYNFLRSKYSVEDFVQSLEFISNIYNIYFAYYLPSEKKLVVNFNKISNDVHTYINSLNISNDDKVLALHLCFFHYINHEFKHIYQEKEKTNNPKAIESRLLILSDQLERYYRSERMLVSLYDLDPIERQAELSSLRQFISMAKTRNMDILTTKMTTKYLQKAREGYKSEKNYPAKSFLNKYWHYNYRIEKLIEELDEYPITEDNLETRLELGLRITKNEYKSLTRL